MEFLSNSARRRRRLLLLQVGMLLSCSAGAFGGQMDEYDVKAAFLLNFAKFVEWPAAADSPELVICIVGDDPFGTTLDRLTRGKTANQRAIQVRRVKDPVEARGCHIAFVRSEERDKASKLLDDVGTAPVLTIGEARDFAEKGGVICLPVEDGRVNVVINTAAAEHAQLKISAKLLTLAELFPGPRPRN